MFMTARIISEILGSKLNFISTGLKTGIYQVDDETAHVVTGQSTVVWTASLDVRPYGVKAIDVALGAVSAKWQTKDLRGTVQDGHMSWTPKLEGWEAEVEFDESGVHSSPIKLMPVAVAIYVVDRRVVVSF